MEGDLQTIWLNDDLCEARDFRDENEHFFPFLNDDSITIICWNEWRIPNAHDVLLQLALNLVFIYRRYLFMCSFVQRA